MADETPTAKDGDVPDLIGATEDAKVEPRRDSDNAERERKRAFDEKSIDDAIRENIRLHGA
ncbi:MAG: hypothetical protein ABIO29_04700 [Sphingomicrobium sp.]